MYFHGARFSNYEAWLSDPTHIKPSAQVVWPIVGQEILNGDVGGGFQGVQITSGLFQMWRASGITSELQLYTTAIGGLVLAALMFFAGWFHYHKAAPKLEWFQNVESVMNHHLGGLLGLGSLGWAGHQIHVSLPVNKLLDAGVDPKEIPLPHEFILNKAILVDLYPSFAKGLAPFFTLNWSEYSDFLTFKGGLNPVTGGLWLSDSAHHHVAIAVLFLVAGHQYRTNWGIGHSMKEILDYLTTHEVIVPYESNLIRKSCLKKRTSTVENSLPSFERTKNTMLSQKNTSSDQTFSKKKSNESSKEANSSLKSEDVVSNLDTTSTNAPTSNKRLPFKLNLFFLPGIYCIVNKKTNIRYVGEAANLADRLSDHHTSLSNNRHSCDNLQQDWNTLGADCFDFLILESGIHYVDRTKRLQPERKYIQDYRDNTYNQMGLTEIKQVEPGQNRPNSIPVMVDGTIFPSVSAASREYGIALATARNNLNSSAIKNWQYVDQQKRRASNVARPVVVNNCYYPSVALAAAGEGISVKTVGKLIKENQNWCYFDELSLEDKANVTGIIESQEDSFVHGKKSSSRRCSL
jgi:hypothetical protein